MHRATAASRASCIRNRIRGPDMQHLLQLVIGCVESLLIREGVHSVCLLSKFVFDPWGLKFLILIKFFRSCPPMCNDGRSPDACSQHCKMHLPLRHAVQAVHPPPHEHDDHDDKEDGRDEDKAAGSSHAIRSKVQDYRSSSTSIPETPRT